MPIYRFINEKTNEVKEILMSMKEKHEYVDKTGYKWKRIFENPCVSFDTKINPFSEKDFVQKTGKKIMTQKEYWDESKALSEKRKSAAGTDPVLDKYYSDWSAKRKNKVVHPDVQTAKIKENLAKSGVILEG